MHIQSILTFFDSDNFFNVSKKTWLVLSALTLDVGRSFCGRTKRGEAEVDMRYSGAVRRPVLMFAFA